LKKVSVLKAVFYRSEVLEFICGAGDLRGSSGTDSLFFIDI
jgi:hypothetical protein